MERVYKARLLFAIWKDFGAEFFWDKLKELDTFFFGESPQESCDNLQVNVKRGCFKGKDLNNNSKSSKGEGKT